MDEIGRLSHFYIAYTTLNRRVLEQSNLKLKYNYSDQEVLARIEKLINTPIPESFKKDEHITTESFYNNLFTLLLNLDNDKINKFFISTYSLANIMRKDELLLDDCKAHILQNSKTLEFNIEVPNMKIETDTLHAALIHELSHFSLLLGRDRRDIYEYSEVLSIFFEYMMYKTINGEDGEKVFLNNRLSMLKDTFDDLKDDMMYASNPQYLGIDSKYYEMCLASNISYPESFEYVLQLLKRRKEDKRYVDRIIGNLLFGDDTLENAARKLEIDTKEYPETYKLIK